ncbi:CSC1-like protein HYP1 isoform X5 [Cynara cardunculus var. scolymus]|uniref:CSC1-like protein HYP1 isoform X5 n=1 Tax=Cynara cardunculus var. scolymus TaxID=59895 RepID=UPI000D62DDED|nr:CSC1-like protein HYP1 isoform X5 [Cynara cardunculus var. scolymus]
MILSALLTSVGINLGLCFLFFTLYSILRKQPGNADVYAPRLVAEGKSDQRNDFNLERLLPSTSWVKRSWNPSEQELLVRAGLDGVVFMRIIIFSLKVFAFAGVLGLCVLLPINYMGSQIVIDFSDITNMSLESFMISNVNDGSKRLWVHFSAVYVFTAFVCYLLYVEYSYISAKRLAFFYSSKPKPDQFTVLVRGTPKSSTDSFSGSVEKFFTEYYPTLYLSHYMVYHTTKIQKLISDAEKVHRKLALLKSTQPTSKRFGRVGFLGIFGPKVDLLEYYEKKLEELEDNVRMQQSLLSGKETSAAFVSFKSRLGAAIALHIQQGENPTEWLTEQAPEPQDIYWPFFSASFISIWIGNVVVVVACIALTLLFFVPVILVQSLTHLDQLETWFPFLKGVLQITFVSQVITGYLPSLILKLFLYFVPPVMTMLSCLQGYVAHSQIEKSASNKMLWFTIWNVFFVTSLSGSVLYQVHMFWEPKEIPNILAVAVPAQATFFITYVVTSGWTSTASELFRLMPLISSFTRRNILTKTGEQFEVPSVPYSRMFWPIVHNSTVFSLVLMHLIAVGIFGLKKIPLAASLTIPLPIITLLFNGYCRKRFLPVFKGYPAERPFISGQKLTSVEWALDGYRFSQSVRVSRVVDLQVSRIEQNDKAILTCISCSESDPCIGFGRCSSSKDVILPPGFVVS